jgi:rubrerythrin
MPLSKEEIKQIAEASAQAVLESLHRYTVVYKEPETIEQGLQESMIEERTAADWYRKRAKNAADYHVDGETMALYQDIAVDEDEHYTKLNARLQELGKEVEKAG